MRDNDRPPPPPVFGETWICDACGGKGWRKTSKANGKHISCGWCKGTGLRRKEKEPE